MSGFIANNNTYNIATENEATIILSRFNDEYIFNIIEENLENRFRYYYDMPLPNIVHSLEQNYKNMLAMFPQNTEEIQIRRIQNYKKIIDILCNKHNLIFVDSQEMDYFSIAAYLYDFLISNFKNYLVMFFTNYIDREKNNLYTSLDLQNLKKNKDISTLHAKKTYKNQKLAIINSNIEFVIKSISVQDIDFKTVLDHIYYDKNISKYIITCISPEIDFFSNIYVPIMNSMSDFKFSCLSEIRMMIHNLATTTTN